MGFLEIPRENVNVLAGFYRLAIRWHNQKTICMCHGQTSPEPCHGTDETCALSLRQVSFAEKMGEARLFRKRRRQGGFDKWQWTRFRTRKDVDCGTNEEIERDHGRDRIAGNPKTGLPLHNANTAGLPGRMATASKQSRRQTR